jgi:hypothetical protein
MRRTKTLSNLRRAGKHDEFRKLQASHLRRLRCILWAARMEKISGLRGGRSFSFGRTYSLLGGLPQVGNMACSFLEFKRAPHGRRALFIFLARKPRV